MGSEERRLGAARAQIIAWAVIGVANVIAAHVDPPARKLRGADRWLRDAYDLGHALALGVLSALLVLAWTRARLAAPRLSPRAAGRADLAAIAAASCALAFPLLRGDLTSFAERSSSASYALPATVLAVASAIPIAALLGRALARPVLRWVAVALAVALAAANDFVLTLDYPGVHLYLPWAAAVLGGAAIADLPARSSSPLAARVAMAGAAILGAWSVIVRPRDLVLLAMLEQRASVLTPFLARAQTPSWSSAGAVIPPDLAPWFADRAGAPDVPPTPGRSHPEPIVILYTIDSLRAEVVESGRHDAMLPQLARMKREGAHFTHARSPGSGTVFSVSSLFTGKYYSDLYWTPRTSEPYPWQDDSARLPALLAARGVPTAAFFNTKLLIDELGIARGFAEESLVTAKKKSGPVSTGRLLGEALRARLERHDDGPLFVWGHNMDPHSPYDLGGTEGSAYERYVREVALVDQELGALRDFIEQKGWADRVTLVVSADHGEGFGEHGLTDHSVSLYEELIHVPLLVVGPGVKPRAVDTPVTLMDVGPTILDLMGLPAPGRWLGQSLVPLLRGEDAKLTRPICAESRLMQAILLPGGLKLIRDLRRGTREIYDLALDPGETTNLFEEGNRERGAQMALLAAFFDVHTLRRPGYRPPYRK